VTAPPRGTCVWGCGRTRFNKEHIIGKQIAKGLKITLPVQLCYSGFEGQNERTLEVVLRDRVCKTCNGGWMKKLDDRLMTFMSSAFANGDTVVLTPYRQKTLAFWAFKVALLLELFSHEHIPERHVDVPAAQFTQLYRHQQPPDRSKVWIARADTSSLPIAHSGGIYLFSPQGKARVEDIRRSGAAPIAWAFTFHVGQVFAYVFGWEEGLPPPDGSRYDPMMNLAKSFVQVWPKSLDDLTWPPEQPLTNAEITILLQRPPEW
jgi:hypothetical protein